MSNFIHTVCTCIVTAAVASTANAQNSAASISCGSPYTVARGDTLSLIAKRAYGSFAYQALHAQNLSVIGPNPNILKVGQQLSIPCKDAPVTQTADVAETPTQTVADATPEAPEAPAAEIVAEVEDVADDATVAEVADVDDATSSDTLVFTFNKVSAPPFVINASIIDPYLAEITEVTEGRVQFVDPEVMNRDHAAQYDIVVSGEVDGAYVFNGVLSESHPFLQLPMLPLMGGSAEQTALSLWYLHDTYLADTNYFDDAQLLGFVAAPAAHIWRDSTVPVAMSEDITSKNMYPVPYFEGLDTRGPAVVREEFANMVADYTVTEDSAPTFLLAHGAARAVNVWNDSLTVTEVDYGMYTPTFTVMLSNEAWDQISPADQDAILAISGEQLAHRSASWDVFDSGFRRDMIANNLKITKAGPELLRSLETQALEGMQDWISYANMMDLPAIEAINAYRAKLKSLEELLIFR